MSGAFLLPVRRMYGEGLQHSMHFIDVLLAGIGKLLNQGLHYIACHEQRVASVIRAIVGDATSVFLTIVTESQIISLRGNRCDTAKPSMLGLFFAPLRFCVNV